MHQGCSEFLALGKTQGFRGAFQSFGKALFRRLHGFGSPVCQCHIGPQSIWILPTQHGQHGGQSIPKKYGHCQWLAQDLAECWQVPSAFCTAQFQNLQNTGALSTEAGLQFERNWNTTAISTQGTVPKLLQNLQISVKWPNQDKLNGSNELRWEIRRASTPDWVGL